MTPRARAFLLAVSWLAAAGCKDEPVRVARVEITPATASLLVGPGGGQSLQLAATPYDGKGQVIEGRTVSWRVVGAPNASVSATGLVTALQVGAAVVEATVQGRSAQRTVTVLPVPVATLELSPGAIALGLSPLGAESAAVTATLRDSTGAELAGRAVLWATSDAAVATVSGGTVTATGGGTAVISASAEGRADSIAVTVTATTELPAGVDIAVTGAQWTQGVQDADESIPMLRKGRAAVVNVTTVSNAQLLTPAEFVLRLYDAGGAAYRSDTVRAPIPLGATTLEAPTVQFLVPSSAIVEGMSWVVERDPRQQVADADAANDRLPAAGASALAVVTPPVLKLRFVPVVLGLHGNTTGNVSTANIEQYLVWIRRFMPHGAIEATVGPPLVSLANYGTAPSGASSTFWTALLPELDAARVADPTYFDAHWVGVVAPPAGFNNAVNGGWAYIPSSGTSTGPGTRTFAVINVGWFTNQNRSGELMAHELAHNLGRAHAPGCGAAGTDPAFPRPDGSIGAFAHQTYAWEIGVATRAAAIPAATPDVMGYCTGIWVSAYTYAAMQAFRGAEVVALQGPATRARSLLVQGQVTPQGVEVNPPRRLTTRPSGDDASGAWVVELLDADDVVLHRQRFALGAWDHSGDLRPFAVAVPLPAAVEARLAKVRVTGPGGAAVVRAVE